MVIARRGGQVAPPGPGGRARLSRWAIGFLVIGAPVMLGLYYLSGLKPFLYAMYAGLSLLLLSSVRQMIADRSARPVHKWYAALSAVLVLMTGLALATPGAAVDHQKMGALLLCICWCGTLFSVYGHVRLTGDSRPALAAFRAAAVVLTGSVYASAGLWLLGIEFGEVLDFGDSIRAFGPLGDQVAFVLVLFVLTSVAHGAWLSTAVHAGALLLTATRGALVCLLVGLAVLNLLPGRQRSRMRAVRSAAAAVVVGLLLLSPAGAVMVERLLTDDPRSRYGGRLQAIETGLEVVRQHPVTGVGFYGFEQARWAVYESAFVDHFTDRSFATTANQLVQTATDGGLFALLMLVGLCVAALRTAWSHPRLTDSHSRKLYAGFAAWVIAVLIGNQSAPWLLPDATLGYFLMAAIGFLEATRQMDVVSPGPGGQPPVRRLVRDERASPGRVA